MFSFDGSRTTEVLWLLTFFFVFRFNALLTPSLWAFNRDVIL